MNKLNNFISKFLIIFATLLMAESIAKYFNCSIKDSVGVGFLASIFSDIIIDIAGVRNE